MALKKYTLPKEERISLKRHLDKLFEKGQSFISYPLRVVYFCSTEEMPARASIMVSVSKRKFKRAVKRNHIKRLVREAYRIRKYELINPLTEKNKYMLVAFLFLDKELPSSIEVGKALSKAIRLLVEKEHLKELTTETFVE